MITLTSKIQAVEGKEDALEPIPLAFAGHVKSEDGAIIYNLHRIIDKKGCFLFYERFRDKEAFESHGSTSHMKKLINDIGGLLAKAPEMDFLEEIASIA
jgi:quinol monooxygenase YgiN